MFIHRESYHQRERHSSSSSSSFSSRSSYYSNTDPGTDNLSHWLGTQALNCIWITIVFIILLCIAASPFCSALIIAVPFIILLKISAYFCFWKPDMDCQGCLTCCGALTWIQALVFFAIFFGKYHPIMQIDLEKSNNCNIIDGQQIQLGYETYTALNVQLTTKEGKFINGYGCISSEKYSGDRSEITSKFQQNIAICLKEKNSTLDEVQKTISYNYPYNNYLIQETEDGENQNQLNQLDSQNSKTRILRVGGGGRSGGSRGGGSRSRGSRSSYYSSGYRSRGYSSSYYSSYYSGTVVLYYGGYGNHYNYGNGGPRDYDNVHPQGENCQKIVRFAKVKIPAWLCADTKEINKIARSSKCYYTKYGHPSQTGTYSSQYDPKEQSNFYLVTFDSPTYYDRSGWKKLVLFFLVPWLVFGLQCVCVYPGFTAEKYLVKYIRSVEKRYHPSRHHQQQQNNINQPLNQEIPLQELNGNDFNNRQNLQNQYPQFNDSFNNNNNQNHQQGGQQGYIPLPNNQYGNPPINPMLN